MAKLTKKTTPTEGASDAKLATTTFVATATATAAGLAAAVHPNLTDALVTMFPALVLLAATGLARHRVTLLHRWLAMVLTGDDQRTAEEVKGLVEERVANNPGAQKSVIDAAQAMLGAHECVTAAVAVLSRPYILGDREVDAFFRGMLSVLSAVTEPEYRALQTLFARLASVSPPLGYPTLRISWARDGATILVAAIHVAHRVPIDDTFIDPVKLGAIEHADRVLHLLRSNDVTRENFGGTWGGDGTVLRWSPEMLIDADDVARVARIVRD